MRIHRPLHIQRNKPMHPGRVLHKAHPEIPICMPIDHAVRPVIVQTTRVPIAVRRRRLREPVRVFIRDQVYHEAEHITVDHLAVQPRERRSDGALCFLDPFAPGLHARSTRPAEVIRRHGREVLGVDVTTRTYGPRR